MEKIKIAIKLYKRCKLVYNKNRWLFKSIEISNYIT